MHKMKCSETYQEKQGVISYINPCTQEFLHLPREIRHTPTHKDTNIPVCVIKQDAYMNNVVGWHIIKSQMGNTYSIPG